MTKYSFSLNEEEWYDSEYTLQLIEDLVLQDSDIIYIGENQKITHKEFYRSVDIQENMLNRAYDEFDELADNYLDWKTNKEKFSELDKLVLDWLDKNIEQPTFYRIINTKEITVKEFKENYE